MVPSFVGVAAGDTSSGFVEIESVSTLPTNTSIQITVLEDTNGDGTSNRQQSVTLSGGTETFELDLLDSTVASGNTLWLSVELSTTDENTTPELDTVTVTLPESSGDSGGGGTVEPTPVSSDPQNLDSIIDNYLFFISAVILAVGGIGVMSGSLAIGAVAAYTTFTLIAIQTGEQLLVNILVVTLVLVFVGFAFKFWRLEGIGE
jgi:hypothetical protein